jgi:hypothetical protein
MALEHQVDRSDGSPRVVTWRQMLVDVGGLSANEFADFLGRMRAFAAEDRFGWLEHETPGYDTAYELIPQELRAVERAGELIPLKNRIHDVLDRYFHRQTFDPLQIPEIRESIVRVVSEWSASRPARTRGKPRG